ncbi:type II secretion system protein [bacterium]|nr:type II secretion system protein [bacterium]
MNKLKFTKNLTFGSGKFVKEGWRYRGMDVWQFNNSDIGKIRQEQQNDNGYISRHEDLFTSKKAFTLAEVLITLGVIGVVAAITLPALFTNITGYVNTKRQENIGQKVTQAMEQMRAHGLLNTQYSSTESFVDEFQKYIKISKRCDSEHIAECWPTEKVTTGDDEEYEVSQAKTGKHLSLESESNNVGLVLIDGAPIILNYNPSAPAIDVGDKVKWTEGLPKYTTTVTGAIDFIMDVNGGKGPNSEQEESKRDISSFKSAKFSKGELTCEEKNGIEIQNVGCVVDTGKTLNWDDARTTCADMGMELLNETYYNTIKRFAYCSQNMSNRTFWLSNESRNAAGYITVQNNCVMSSGGYIEKSSKIYVLCVGN